MKCSVIDMGSNSVRLMIADTDGEKILKTEKMLEMTRLAQGVDNTMLLQEHQMDETIVAIKNFKNIAQIQGAGVPMAFATSAVRDALNGKAFAERVHKETGVSVEIIPGNIEAELGFMGVLATLEEPEEDILVIDIGGGSTECVVGSCKGIKYAKSINAGAVRMTGRHVKCDPILETEYCALKEDIYQTLSPFYEDLGGKTPSGRVYGIGGTLTTAAAMILKMEEYNPYIIQNYEVTLEALKELIYMLKILPQEKRIQIPGLQPKRADVIMAGFLIMETLMETLGVKAFYSSDADNMEGILFKYTLKR